MRSVKTLFALRRLKPTTELVYVSTVAKIYRCHEGEWFEQVNYTTKQVAMITRVTQRRVQHIIRRLNLRPKVTRHDNLGYDEVRVLIQALHIKHDFPNKTYEEIKKELKV